MLIGKLEDGDWDLQEIVEFPSVNKEDADFPSFQGGNLVLTCQHTVNTYLGTLYVYVKYITYVSVQICVCHLEVPNLSSLP